MSDKTEDEAVVQHCIGKTIVDFEVKKRGSYSGVVTITLSDKSTLTFSAWDDGGYALGELLLPDGDKKSFCGG